MDDATGMDRFRKLIKLPEVYPLLPRHRVYLFAPEPSTKEEGKRFARLFIETWKQIPLGPRRAMLRHWKDPNRDFPLPLSPKIELLPSWSGHKLRRGCRGLGGTKAATSCQGHELRFWTKIVAVYPDNLVRDLIAHELAHVCQAAEGWHLGTADPQALEEDADIRVASWEFDIAAMDEWDRANLERG